MAKLITGGTGYIGAELAHILVERGDPAHHPLGVFLPTRAALAASAACL
jgi:nucleoside-diphosphate-sugar epimerase